ncbi:hypothetical protein DQM28_10020 [Leptospira mayottensis]|uniref:Uncharacterized protein n=1 Tax=Leptospira mayottensis TaxID=1137606 RepID=A0ABM6YDB9_9LEPT|nr:hypothetical protein DQM28_10020 [Leptospira mayottensis]
MTWTPRPSFSLPKRLDPDRCRCR